jgi:hypothetical protein
MIAFVRGQVAAVTLNSAVLDVGGIGLELMCTPGTLATLRTGQTATLPTSMVVREDSLTIFGFLDEDEKVCFSSSSAKPKSVSESSRTTMLVGSVASRPVRSVASVPGVHITSRPTPPTSSTALDSVTAATLPETNAITTSSLLPRARRRSGPGRRRARCG